MTAVKGLITCVSSKAEAATREGNNLSGMCAGAFIVSKLHDVLCPVNQAFIANITILYIH